MSQQDNPYLTITLTGRPPVKIKKDEWPVLASAGDKEFDNQYEFQANRLAKWKLTVRQHADGRAIVYAVYTFTSQFMDDEHDHDVRAGSLFDAGVDIPDAIRTVADEIESRMPNDATWSTGYFPRLAHECVADLPAVEI